MLPKLIQILDVEQIDALRFKAQNLNIGSPRVYGGQVLAQSLAAASRTVKEDRFLHSIHGYFLRPGDNAKEIVYEVELARDGGSFSTRRVRGLQGDRVIFVMASSFQIKEEGFEHQATMPNVAQPESLSSFPEIFSAVAEKFDIKPKGIFSDESPIIFRPVEHYNPFEPGVKPAKTHIWFKPNGEFKITERDLEKILLAYVSDFNLLMTALLPHNVSMFTEPLFIASLDHAMWFHRSFEMDDWMLYVIRSPYASNARGFCTGEIFSRTGKLLASVTQEGLIRKMSTK